MSISLKQKPLAAAIGAAFVTSMTAGMPAIANADQSPFAATNMSEGYMVLAEKGKEGKCGGSMSKEGAKKMEGKCGGEMKKKEGKCGEGKCGEGKKMEGKTMEGKCGEGKKDEKKKEGKCGEGKCGGKK